MPPPDNNRLIAWYLLIKDEWLPAQRLRLREWWSAARQEPRLIWETPQVRYSVLGAGGLAVVLAIAWFAEWAAPAPSASARPQATTANFHVVCSDLACGHHFLVERKFRFKRFPVECPRCGQRTGQRARRCTSTDCGGAYVAVVEADEEVRCSQCDARLGAAP